VSKYRSECSVWLDEQEGFILEDLLTLNMFGWFETYVSRLLKVLIGAQIGLRCKFESKMRLPYHKTEL
jgi:hypothetical protein